MRAYLTEAIGTFFVVLTVYLTVVARSPFAPLAIGAAVMVMVYMGHHLSGGHYNPAVSLAVWMRGRLAGGQLVPYWVAQLLGAVLGALAGRFVTHQAYTPAPPTSTHTLAALAVELLFTFALCLVYLHTAASEKTKGNSYFGLAIGFTVAAGSFAGGPLSGAAFNPAAAIGPTLVSVLLGAASAAHAWIYIVAPLVGGVVAAWAFRLQGGDA